MITYDSGGRLGNQLFQHVSARLLAEKLGYKLGTKYCWNDTISVNDPKDGIEYLNDKTTIIETVTTNLFQMNYERKHYHLQGYWQNAEYYLLYRDKIISYFNEKATLKTNKKDIVIHIRLSDYKTYGSGGTVLDKNYYLECLSNEKFDKLFILTDSPNDEYINHFRIFNPFIICRTEKEDFWFMTEFDRIIIGNSTFSWWAAFLSNASKIYTPSCWIRNSESLHHSLEKIQNGIIVKANFIDY